MAIKLLSTDFDGTLVDHDEVPAVRPELFEILAFLRSCGVIWAVNTGRALNHILEGLEEFKFPFPPDYILTNEREIFRPGPNGWEDYGDWNHRCSRAHDELFLEAEEFLLEIIHFIRSHTSAQTIFENRRPVGLIASTDEELERVIAFIDERRHLVPRFHYQRNTIFLRFCHVEYHKGAALSELGRLLGIPPEHTFAAGDHYNDIPMLTGEAAHWVACPENAIDAVKQTVLNAKGYVARQSASGGVAEALRFFAGEEVMGALLKARVSSQK